MIDLILRVNLDGLHRINQIIQFVDIRLSGKNRSFIIPVKSLLYNLRIMDKIQDKSVLLIRMTTV